MGQNSTVQTAGSSSGRRLWISRTLDNIEGNIREGSHFIVDYRDVVGMMYRGEWGKKYSEKKNGRKLVSIGKGIDTVKGDLLIRSETDGRHNLDFAHAVWSPFIIEPLMAAKGWSRVCRFSRPEWRGWLDVYRRDRGQR